MVAKRSPGRPPEADPRSHQKHIKFNDAELATLQSLAEQFQTDPTKAIRRALKEAAEKHLPPTLVLNASQQQKLNALARSWRCSPTEALDRLLQGGRVT